MGEKNDYVIPKLPGVTGEFVFPDWFKTLRFQMQSVLILAGRGPDGVRKHHPAKELHRAYRATILKAGLYGRALTFDDKGDSFMRYSGFAKHSDWEETVKTFFDHVDELPHHYTLHMVHAAHIVAVFHPDPTFRYRWRYFYDKAVDDLHMRPETDDEMIERLNDFGQNLWQDNDSS